ncbi:20645_t:CDS:2 [Rhizophagus irregularis]|nr:20645_t:CDS:2 [Rhizophagus irregularis]
MSNTLVSRQLYKLKARSNRDRWRTIKNIIPQNRFVVKEKEIKFMQYTSKKKDEGLSTPLKKS